MEKHCASEIKVSLLNLEKCFSEDIEPTRIPNPQPETQEWVKTLQVSYNASGAVAAAQRGDVVVIVDVIDMSTTAEAALEAGAVSVYGAAPAGVQPPVQVNPEGVGMYAGTEAVRRGTEVILIAEPRYGSEAEREEKVRLALTGIRRSGATLAHILPNIGGEVSGLADFDGRVVVIVSDTGGVAFDAAWTYGARNILTGTIARTRGKKGTAPLEAAVERAIAAANQHRAGITFVAASASSYEDILAAETLARKVVETGFLCR